MEKMKKLLTNTLECGELDVEVLLGIDGDILAEAISRLKDEGVELNFPSIFREAVRVVCEKYNVEVSEVDANYVASRVYVSDERAYKVFEELGFPVLM